MVSLFSQFSVEIHTLIGKTILFWCSQDTIKTNELKLVTDMSSYHKFSFSEEVIVLCHTFPYC